MTAKRATKAREAPPPPERVPAGDVPMRPGKYGGLLRSGGNPGPWPGAGRKPDEFKAMCRKLTTAAMGKRVARILAQEDHPQFMRALEWAAAHGYGKPTESVKVNHAGRLIVQFQAEGTRGRGK